MKKPQKGFTLLEAVVAMLTAQQVEPVMSRATLTSLENLIEQNQKH